MTVEVKLYEPNNTTLVANLTSSRQVRSVKGRDTLSGVGDGELVVDYDHPNVAALTGDRIIQVHENGRVPLAFSIEKKRSVIMPQSGDDSGRTVTVSGRTLRGVLEQGRVWPWLPPAGTSRPESRPVTRRRVFNAASPTINTGSWPRPYVQGRANTYPRKPRGMASLDPSWLWGTAETIEYEDPVGDCWFARDFTLTTEEVVVFVTSADDQFTEYLHGAELQRQDEDWPALNWQNAYRSAIRLTPGTYRYVVKVHNAEENGPGGFICEAWKTGSSGITERLFASGTYPLDPQLGAWEDPNWKCLPYPTVNDVGFGHTVGKIANTLLDECHDRGELLNVTTDFTSSVDSDGAAWNAIIPEIDFDCTSSFGDAIDKLEATYADVEVSYSGGIVLRLFNKETRGSTKPITISQANGTLLSHSVEETFEVENNVMLVRDRGLFEWVNNISQSLYGRRGGRSLQVGSVDDPTTLGSMAAMFLLSKIKPGESVIVETTPLLDFAAAPGDSITMEDRLLRVSEVAMELNSEGNLRSVPVLNTPFQQMVQESEKRLDRVIKENGGPAESKALDTGTEVRSGKLNPIRLTSWSWNQPEDLDSEEWSSDPYEPIGWQPFTVEETCRLWQIEVSCKWAEPDGVGGYMKITEMDSVFTLFLDGQRAVMGRGDRDNRTGFINVIVPEELSLNKRNGTPQDLEVTGRASIYAPSTLLAGQRISVSCTQNGGHVEGSITVSAVEAI